MAGVTISDQLLSVPACLYWSSYISNVQVPRERFPVEGR